MTPKQIGAAILAADISEHTVDDRFQITIDGLTLRCTPTQDAVARMASKFTKHRNRSSVPSNRPLQAKGLKATVRAMCAEGDYENACELLKANGLPVVRERTKLGLRSPLLDVEWLPTDVRFVVGLKWTGKWCVTHIASGLSAGGEHESREAALAQFARRDKGYVDLAIAAVPQTLARLDAETRATP